MLHSSCKQCRLERREADAAVSDATRGLVLAWPANVHARSLWRRVQAYDMKGTGRASWTVWTSLEHGSTAGNTLGVRRAARGANPKLPYCVARMISKQTRLRNYPQYYKLYLINNVSQLVS